MEPRPLVITKKRREIEGIHTFWLEPRDGGEFHFDPGQFNMLYVFGAGEVPISISGDPGKPGRLVHTVRAVGKATQRLCALKTGESLGVRGPFGSAWPMAQLEGKNIVFVTSGLGLAPLRPAVYWLLNHRQRYGKATLIYGARNPRRLLYVDELRKWRGRFDLRVELAVGSADPTWDGNIGVVTSLVSKTFVEPGNTVALICSSERMMRAMVEQLNQAGLNDGDIYLSLERSIKCGLGLCGHCQLGPTFICKDGPVYRYDQVKGLLAQREL
ncbi:MAG: FAD/NAD(P)-binding protein [Proteobacteria bacterium]|nr:FAD/NAD(P)-binding protein [Pseudomonadota bacterium]MBU1451355.1 FAD/NAD(P)-binding protein [Pseudomonadota bacterium]MBU2469524.1 FAD/NAD(P)-binding protein [Pseudomonadota bacterium]